MKTARSKRSARPAPAGVRGAARREAHPPQRNIPPSREVAELRARLAEAEETLRAISDGEVDSVVVPGRKGPQVFTLHGENIAYRELIESINEGALTLTVDKTIIYANQCFARMVKCPLEQVIGNSFRPFISEEDRAILRPLLQRPTRSGSKIQVMLIARDGSQLPAQISIRPLTRNRLNQATISMVVTDLTEARRTEELLRSLTHRVVQLQEAERGSVALELHDDITQLLCAILVRSQTLANQLSAHESPSKDEAIKLREMLGETARKVERISQKLRPGGLAHLGLVSVLHDTSTQFMERTGVIVKLSCVELATRMPPDTELSLYRIFQEVLRNIEQHSRARHVSISLTHQHNFIQLAIYDDGVGFDPARHAARKNGQGGFGLLSMRERVTSMSGVLLVTSGSGKGTTIRAQLPLIIRKSWGGGKKKP